MWSWSWPSGCPKVSDCDTQGASWLKSQFLFVLMLGVSWGLTWPAWDFVCVTNIEIHMYLKFVYHPKIVFWWNHRKHILSMSLTARLAAMEAPWCVSIWFSGESQPEGFLEFLRLCKLYGLILAFKEVYEAKIKMGSVESVEKHILYVIIISKYVRMDICICLFEPLLIS